MWKCRKCGEDQEDNFVMCWSCQTERDTGLPVSDFPSESKELKEKISKLSDAELLQKVNELSRTSESDPFRVAAINFGNDHDEQITLVKEELLKRGLSKPKTTEQKSENTGNVVADFFTSVIEDLGAERKSEGTENIVARESNEVASLMKRYSDAYIVAKTINGFGGLIKIIGIIVAVLLVLIGFVVANKNGPRDPVSYLGIAGIALGVISGGLFYVIGVLVSAQGQILKASLDNAVNSSPFLTNEHRAKIMSL